MYHIEHEAGLYQVFDGVLAFGPVFGSYADALAYQRSLQRSLAQLPDDDYYYDQVLA